MSELLILAYAFGAFAMLLAGFVFLHFAGAMRSVLGSAETTVRGSSLWLILTGLVLLAG